MLSARLFQAPQRVGNRIFFISNMSGHLSLYAMDYGGSVPEPLLPPEIALQNPHLVNGDSFYVFPKLGKILISIDQDGNEDYKPNFIPIEGGYPEPAFGDTFDDYKVYFWGGDPEGNIVYLYAGHHKSANQISYKADLESGELTHLYESIYGAIPDGHSKDHAKIALVEGYTMSDNVLRLWEAGKEDTSLLFGVPMEAREAGVDIRTTSVRSSCFIRDDQGIIFRTTLFEDTGGLGYLDLDKPDQVTPVEINGIVHTGTGELVLLKHHQGDEFVLAYNIDGCDWVYEGTLDEELLVMSLDKVIVGQGELSNGVIEHMNYEKANDNYVLSFSTATSPTQIYTIEGEDRKKAKCHTREKVLGIPAELLSSGEDASYTSFDGLRISARLYLPNESLGFDRPLPLVYYLHGGPQSQERPDFAWFSMPLIQFLTLSGFAVFVPNVRGSTGYGEKYTKMIDNDWGGQDSLDHVHAMTEVLPKDPRLDTKRTGVVGRSYGGYMTLMLAGRHPDLWKAAVDMFGPYDLLTFSDRIPETWKPYFAVALGDPNTEEGRAFLTERSPRSYIDNLGCPMLVIQGKNDPRVVEKESHDLVEHLRAIGKDIDYLMFEDEGHDVLKFKNRVRVYNAITDYFIKHLVNG
jgi:pimeloyl-ACP methyl ester carboxylesterase